MAPDLQASPSDLEILANSTTLSPLLAGYSCLVDSLTATVCRLDQWHLEKGTLYILSSLAWTVHESAIGRIAVSLDLSARPRSCQKSASPLEDYCRPVGFEALLPFPPTPCFSLSYFQAIAGRTSIEPPCA
jgi:hypothetical protein